MKEATYVHGRDLRPGDVIMPNMRVRAVRVGTERVEVVVQSTDGSQVTGYCGAEAWIQLAREGP